MREITCHQCGKKSFKDNGGVNRSLKSGSPLFCDKVCSGLSRRIAKTKSEKVAAKRLYDLDYRRKNKKMLKAKKHKYFKETYDPIKAAEHRKTRMPQHIQYCRQPWYRDWKRKYDRVYRAKKFYGTFWEHYLLVLDIEKEALSRQSWQEMNYERCNTNKTQNRKRAYEKYKFNSTKLETIPLGNLIGYQGGYKTAG